MIEFFNQINCSWEMRYSAFIDDLILFSPEFGRSHKNERSFSRESNDIVVGEVNNRIGYIKIENASRHFDDNIDKCSKNDIIKKIKEFTYA